MRFMGMLLLCACMSAAFADQLYKWVDDQGHVHYTQTPPPGMATKIQPVDVTPKPADPTAVQHSEDLQQQMVTDSKQQADVAAASQQQADQLKRGQLQARCDSLKAQLAAYQEQGKSGQPTLDANGHRTYVNVANRNRDMQKLQNQIATTC